SDVCSSDLTIILPNKKFQWQGEEFFSDQESLVYEALQFQSSLKIQEVSDIIDRKNVLPILKSLIDKKVIHLKEEVYQTYKPKLIKYVKMQIGRASCRERVEMRGVT